MKVVNPFLSIVDNAAGKKASMTISGYLDPWENSSKEVIAVFQELEKNFDEIDIILMNCYGGSIFEGIPMHNAFKGSDKKVNTIAKGLVASMGSILFLSAPPENRYMAKMSRIMIHRAVAGAYGDADQIRSTADLCEQLEGDLIEIYSESTGLSIEDVKSKWMKTGVDNYLDTQACKLYNIIGDNGVVEAALSKDVPKALLKKADNKSIYDFYNKQFLNSINIKENDMKNLALFAAALATAKITLVADATEDQLLEAVNKLSVKAAKADELQAKLDVAETALKEANTAKVTALIEGAVKDGKITAAEKDHYTKLAESSFESVKAILDARAPHKTVSGQVGRGGNQETENKYEGWTFDKFQKEAPNALADIKKSDPDRYKKLMGDYLAARKRA